MECSGKALEVSMCTMGSAHWAEQAAGTKAVNKQWLMWLEGAGGVVSGMARGQRGGRPSCGLVGTVRNGFSSGRDRATAGFRVEEEHDSNVSGTLWLLCGNR